MIISFNGNNFVLSCKERKHFYLSKMHKQIYIHIYTIYDTNKST